MNKILISIVGIIIIIIAYWLISPLWRNIKLNEALPQAPVPTPTPATIKDNMDTMDAATKEKFMKATEEMANKKMTSTDAMPSPSQQPTIIAQAPMIARAHNVKGKALLVQTGGQKILRFENLETINGPDLRIYLSTGLNVEDALDLGPIRATQGNVNYVLPDGTDTGTYKNALIWCRAFGVLFSYAQF